MDVGRHGRREPGGRLSRCHAAAEVEALGPGPRWSAGRKREVVLRLLRGESFDVLSREVGVESAWRRGRPGRWPVSTRSEGAGR